MFEASKKWLITFGNDKLDKQASLHVQIVSRGIQFQPSFDHRRREISKGMCHSSWCHSIWSRQDGDWAHKKGSNSELEALWIRKYQKRPEEIWLVIWNMNFIFPYIGNNHPNWLIFFRGVAQPPTRNVWFFESLLHLLAPEDLVWSTCSWCFDQTLAPLLTLGPPWILPIDVLKPLDKQVGRRRALCIDKPITTEHPHGTSPFQALFFRREMFHRRMTSISGVLSDSETSYGRTVRDCDIAVNLLKKVEAGELAADVFGFFGWFGGVF